MKLPFACMFVVLLRVGVAPPVAHADRANDGTAAARQHHARAVRHFEAQQYDAAIEAFQSAYQIDPRPELVYGIAQAERLRGNCARAIVAYETYLRSGPAERQAAAARANIERCREREAAPAAPPEPTASPATTAEPPVAQPVAATPAFVEAPWYADSLGGVLTVSGVAVGVGGLLAWRYGRRETDARNDAATYDTFLEHSGATYQRVGVGMIFVGGALLVTGLVRYATRGGTSRPIVARTAASWGLAVEF